MASLPAVWKIPPIREVQVSSWESPCCSCRRPGARLSRTRSSTPEPAGSLEMATDTDEEIELGPRHPPK